MVRVILLLSLELSGCGVILSNSELVITRSQVNLRLDTRSWLLIEKVINPSSCNLMGLVHKVVVQQVQYWVLSRFESLLDRLVKVLESVRERLPKYLSWWFRKFRVQPQIIESVPIFFLSVGSMVYLVSKADGTMSLRRLNSANVKLISGNSVHAIWIAFWEHYFTMTTPYPISFSSTTLRAGVFTPFVIISDSENVITTLPIRPAPPLPDRTPALYGYPLDSGDDSSDEDISDTAESLPTQFASTLVVLG
nr:hypothetical protein [Tanacetum cinerariifolium]